MQGSYTSAAANKQNSSSSLMGPEPRFSSNKKAKRNEATASPASIQQASLMPGKAGIGSVCLTHHCASAQ